MDTNTFIEEARRIHGDKYDYSKFIFVNMNTNGTIICPEHGEFEQSPKAHIRQGYGCRKCGRKICAEKTKKTTDQIIKEFRVIHGDKYDYSKVEYINANTKVRIICPEHGEFKQTPHDHLKGVGCKECGKQKQIEKIRYNNEDFIKRANEIHNNFYDYSKTDVTHRDEVGKVVVTCPIHGDFKVEPSAHINNKNGCKFCGFAKSRRMRLLGLDDFIARSNIANNNFYDYSKTDIENRDEDRKVVVTCPIHGDFKINPQWHLNGHGCKKCGRIKCEAAKRSTTEKFIEQAIKVHGNKYDYSKVNYITSKKNVCIICPKHGEFLQRPEKHLIGESCPKCSNQMSRAEDEIFNYCQEHIGDGKVIQREINIIKSQELDIYIPSLNAAIEYNGLRWHSVKFGKDRNYHLNKLKECRNKGINLLQIFEDEYVNKRDIVYNKIKHILKLDTNLPKIMGRKCDIKEIKTGEAKEFLNTYHIQGHVRSSVYLGAFYNNELVAVMSFKEEEKNSLKWELNRFASNYNYICQGVGGKLFKYFVKNYDANEIKSFADRRWTINEQDNIYLKLGFNFDGYTKPEYRYFKESDGLIRQHKFNFRKERLHNKYGFSFSMTEGEMIEKLGYTKIYDCGLIKYIWKKQDGDI